MIIDSRGITRLLLNSGLIGKTPTFLNPTNDGNVTCTIPKLPLPKGNYSIRLSCFSNSGIEDDIENAHNFEVLGGDFYGTGKEATIKDGVLVDFDFNFK